MHIVCVEGATRYGVLHEWMNEFAATAQEEGHEVTRAHVRAVLSGAMPPDVDMVFSIGGVGAGAPFPVPFVTWLTDHPLWNPHLFLLNPQRDGIFVIDHEHHDLCDGFLGLNLPVGFLPHAISIDPSTPPPSFGDDDRPIDVLFAGSVLTGPQPGWEIEGDAVEAVVQAVIELADERWDRPMRDVEICKLCREAERINGVTLDASAHWVLSPVLARVDERLRNRRRVECVRALDAAGVHTHLAGAGWETVEGLEHATLVGAVDNRQVLEMTRQAKIVLNVGPVFNGGWHERVPMAMANGALCLTESNDWLRSQPDLRDAVELCELGQRDALGDVVRHALEDPKREARTREAYELARARHSIAERARLLLAAIEL